MKIPENFYLAFNKSGTIQVRDAGNNVVASFSHQEAGTILLLFKSGKLVRNDIIERDKKSTK